MNSELNLTLCFPRSSSTPLIVSGPKPSVIPENHILLKVDRFGFSANNITYQALGEHPHFRYYDFHSAPENANENVSPKTHGVVPVWGFGTVEASSHPKVHVGERLYGYFAPTRYLLIPVSRSDVNKFALYVPRPHLPPDRRPYNQILRCATDTLYTPETEDLIMLYRPLFWTAFWCEDWLNCFNYHGGCSYILISSASSKTAFCLAYCIQKRISRIKSSDKADALSLVKIIGITSKRNLSFTQRLGLYHEAHDYDSFTSAPSLQGTTDVQKYIYVDVAGNPDLNNKVQTHFSSSPRRILVASISLGMTNLSPATSNVNSIQWNTDTNVSSPSTSDTSISASLPRFEQFFMPEWLDVRRRQLSIASLTQMQRIAWTDLMQDCAGWVKLERIYGGEAVKKAYGRIIKEGLGPDNGFIWSLWNSSGGESDAGLGAKL